MIRVLVIGGGVIGCGVARELSRYDAKIMLLEKCGDVACGSSKANSGIAHAGFDAKANSLKAKFNLRGSLIMEELSKELDFPYENNGALVLCFDKEKHASLEELKARGEANGVKGLEVLTASEIKTLVPRISDNVTSGLLAKSSGIVCPYEMTIALAENACDNGVEFVFNAEVKKLQKQNGVFIVEVEGGKTYEAEVIINCAGLFADKINNMVSEKKYTIIPRKGEYMLMDRSLGGLTNLTLFQQPTHLGKGILIAPTTHHNIIVGPNAQDIEDKDDVNTTPSGLSEIFEKARVTIDTLTKREVITQFAGLRAHLEEDDFVVGKTDVDGFYNALGIESPGLTSAPAIGEFLANLVAQDNKLNKNASFNGKRVGIPRFSKMSLEEKQKIIEQDSNYGKIVCRCECVTEGEIINSLTRTLPAKDLDGIKRRTRAGMGRCGAGFCSPSTMELVSKCLNIKIEDVCKNECGSNIIIKEADKK